MYIQLFEDFTNQNFDLYEAKKNVINIVKTYSKRDVQTIDIQYFNGDSESETISISSGSVDELLAYLKDFSQSKSATHLVASFKKVPIFTLYKNDGWFLKSKNISTQIKTRDKKLKTLNKVGDFTQLFYSKRILHNLDSFDFSKWKGLNVPFFKKWSKTVEYDGMPFSEWGADTFVSYLEGNSASYGEIVDEDIAKLFNLKIGDTIEIFNAYPSGYNDNKNWSEFNSYKGGLYDCFEYLLTTI